MNLIFWQNILSPHQMPYIQALAKQGHDVTVVVETILTEDRIQLGWKPVKTDGIRVIQKPDHTEIEKIVKNEGVEAIHVLAGYRSSRHASYTTKLLIKNKCRVGIISESPDPRSPAHALRWLKYTKERFGYGRHFEFILAMGELGVNWFRKCGYPEDKIYEFGYVVEPPTHTTPVSLIPQPVSHIPTILYAGQLIQRKGLHIFLNAVSQLNGDFRVQMIGSGEKEVDFKTLSKSLNLDGKVQWLGRLPAPEVRRLMQTADLFVLPSYHDGWGAVVNEALMAGTPVIASKECGASSLLQKPFLGATYPSKQVNALSQLLQERIQKGKLPVEERMKIKNWAECITPGTMASYFMSCMESTYTETKRPTPPWIEAKPIKGHP